MAETAAITPQKKEISGPSLSPNRLGAAVEISNSLLIQSSVDVESMIRGLIIQGYQRAIDAAAINGSGSSNQPEGILNNSSVPTGASTDADEPSKLLITELVSKLEAANSTTNNLAFLGAPGLKHLIENTKLDTGSGRFLMEKMNELFGYKFVTSTLVPALSGNFPLIFGDWSKMFLGAPGLKHLIENTKLDTGSGRFLMEKMNELFGYKFVTSTLVPALSGNFPLIFGDWSKMFIGEWGSLSVLSDPYSGALSNSVRLVLNGHADVAIAQPNAFAVNKYFNATDA